MQIQFNVTGYESVTKDNGSLYYIAFIVMRAKVTKTPRGSYLDIVIIQINWETNPFIVYCLLCRLWR